MGNDLVVNDNSLNMTTFSKCGELGGSGVEGVGGAAAGASNIVDPITLWVLSHPAEALIAKAIAEEAFESAVTGTPFQPENVVLDLMTQVGDDIRLTVLSVKGPTVKMGILAPRDVAVHREEVYDKIVEENRLAASRASLENAAKLVRLGGLLDAK